MLKPKKHGYNIEAMKNNRKISKLPNKIQNIRKGQNLSIRTISLIILGIMVVVLVYGAFSGWFDSVVSNFTGSIQYPNPRG